MKTTFRIIVIVLLAAFYGCQNDLSLGVNSSITSDGILSGTIMNDSNRIDSIKVYSDIENLIGKGAVSSDGKFSVVLNTPATAPVLSKIGYVHSGVIISDITAMIGSIYEVQVFKSMMYKGKIYKSNYNAYDSIKSGQSIIQFLYSDRNFTIKGTETNTDSNNSNWNLTFKKGWNEIVMKIDLYSTTSTIVETFSSTITSDLQWNYFPSYNYYVQSKTRGVQAVKLGFLFR